ncbi:uncharacterized protein K452DRAFT_293623 [Aplosporella prunicola CBS 121167]|uniref:Uncharacterized protein n=1 Tax=Aplosporella prunicola CBS 121167 TaxID=1176127 RepID=A0A6A6BW81_9PEZI|nr:uncharacterized protein K452DRAFT_293623 [Aplosporella prunicola CBS 121167]KAF2147157.1 hypothetical protein K452DRAFT_293623 [Aplosporella prunicola CBS 121167]
MNQMDSYNPSFFNQPNARQHFVTTSPAHAQSAHHPPPPQSFAGSQVATPQLAHQQQHQQHQQFNGAAAFPLASSMGPATGPGGVMMQSPRVPQTPYTTASFSTPVSAPPVSSAHHFAQFAKTVSPPRHVSPYATPQNQPQHQQSFSPPDPSPSMAAPVNLQPQAQPKAQTPAKPVAQAVPASPGAHANQSKERERVTLLLDINRELLQEILKLQEQGKGGFVGQPPPNPDGSAPDAGNKVASKEYIDCMRRLQSNLSYLASTAERATKPNQPTLPGPAIMAIPSSPPALNQMYTKLQALFPNWKGGQPVRPAVPGQSPQRPPMMQSSPQQVPSQG